jgi:hypothetical protein
MVLIWCALMLTTLLGMVGLIIDAGMCMASQRQAQNAADAAAIAAMMDKLYGKSDAQATATAVTFVKQYNKDHAPEVTLDPIINFPPTSGAYKNSAGYVEAIVRVDVHTFLIQLLPGASSVQQVSARSVAGIEGKSLGEGVGVLNPSARPGLATSGNGILKVNGKVTVNSEGGGVTETGAPINNGNSGFAASVGGTNSGVYATEIDVVGGVNSPSGFHNYISGGPNPLHTGQLPAPDPLRYLPTPTISNGVDPVYRGTPTSSNGNQQPNDPSGLNTVVTPSTGSRYLQLYPGVYRSITITGGNVHFYPGIYVLQPAAAGATTLSISAGASITANGVMFYNTGSNYNPNTGAPDVNDANSSPPITDGALLGPISINSSATMSPIDTTNTAYNYGGYRPGAPIPISDFNGMLFYQRRNSTQPLTVSGNASQALLTGALYAKFALASFTGQGTFNAQFIVGSISISGNGIVTINFTGSSDSISKSVFLVE